MTLTYVDGDLRDLKVGDVEILRRIYMVFQDRNWTARPWTISDERIFAGTDTFEITYRARGTFDAEPFQFRATLSGDDEGTITYEIDGSTDAPFLRNRLGLCVLHPMTCAGAACIVESVTGGISESAFPRAIAPNQPFADIRAITHEFAPGAWASVRLTGETFEMEDHRNWTDASFKTYCTPISLPFPVEVGPDDTIWQGVTVAVDVEDADLPAPAPDRVRQPVRIDVPANGAISALPRIGLQLPADEPTWNEATTTLLRDLALSHLRLDISTADSDGPRHVADAYERAKAVDAKLIVSVFVDDPSALTTLAAAVQDVPVTAWLVFDAGAKVTGPDLIVAARRAFGPSVRLGAGTNLYFTELNREPVATADLDVVAFSLNPQVHASDAQTVVQNLATQGVVARNAEALVPSAAIHVGPVTLRPRFNPNATQPELDLSNTLLPASVDVRQMSRFCASWTIGSLKYLAASGSVDEITYYETTGWRGVIERVAGSPQPQDFPSAPGQPFPVYDALRLLRGFDAVRPCMSEQPQDVDALLLQSDAGDQRLIVVSFSDRSIEFTVSGVDVTERTRTLEPFGLDVVDIRRAAS